MDGVIRDLHVMPPETPMAMPAQDLRAPFSDRAAPGVSRPRGTLAWRLVSFGPAAIATSGFCYAMWEWFAGSGISWIEGVLLTLIAFNFFWLCFTVCTVALGLASLSREQRPERTAVPPQKVALLMPIYNEMPWYVLGNAASMLQELQARNGGHEYAMFILSDTQDEMIAEAEQVSVAALRAHLGWDIPIYYRRRPDNVDRKVGNIADWVQRWGGAWPAMLVLDADSLMTGRAIVRLTDALAQDPSAGLIQSFPQLIGAQSVFARMQQFANGVYGAALAEGLARWGGQEGNYWGHNAIIRTAAFAACAGLPRMRNIVNGREQLIMSHDFVEAGLLRRAGWGVRFLPRIKGSYEESPHTLIDHIRRDRRWCHGNLQHLRLLWTPGLRGVSRFHLFHGAIGYLLSPIWFALLVMWALVGTGEESSVLIYFSPDNPLIPHWPQMTEGRHVFIILLMYGLLLAPKLMGIAAIPLTGARFHEFGGGARFALSLLSEVFLSVLYAPILMVQQMIAVVRVALGLQKGWAPQARSGDHYSMWDLIRSHALETVSGLALLTGICVGVVSLWLLPIAISLAFAVPLSAFSGVSLGRRLTGWMATRQDVRQPAVSRGAERYRAELKAMLEAGTVTPAE